MEKIDRVEVDEVDNSRLNLKFPPAPRSGDYPVITEAVGKNYGEHTVFKNVDITIKRGDKVAFVGKNGEGKSTLVKCIMSEIPYSGNLKLGHNVKIGYFAQNQAQLLDGEITVFDTIDNVAVGDIRTKIRDILGAFMFGGEASDKKVKVLSGGERSRLAMIKLLLEPVNLLILDEPTNHLDMKTKDILKQAIKDFDGTVIVVSHDREFLDGLVTKVYEFSNQKVTEHLGGVYEFLEKKKIASLKEIEMKAAFVKTEKQDISESKLSYEARREIQRDIRKVEKQIEETEKKISDTEVKISDLEVKLSTPEGASNVALYEDHKKLNTLLSELSDKWMELNMQLEELKEKFN